MTFWYEGKKIRTSKTHHYTHAIINGNGNCIMCSATEDGCIKRKQSFIHGYQENIENCERAIKAIESGKSKFAVKAGNYTYYNKISHSIEEYEGYIEDSKKMIDFYRGDWKIVKIEERA